MEDKVAYKTEKTRGQRFVRLLKSVVNPKAWAHLIKIVNYYNTTHVVELAKAQKGTGGGISPTASFANGHNLILGDRVRIGSGSCLWAGNGNAKIVLGDDVMLAPNVMITAANYRFNDGGPVHAQAMNEADINIGRDVWIGYGAVILPGAQIGEGAIIGARAVVRGTVAPYAIVADAPSVQVAERQHPKP